MEDNTKEERVRLTHKGGVRTGYERFTISIRETYRPIFLKQAFKRKLRHFELIDEIFTNWVKSLEDKTPDI